MTATVRVVGVDASLARTGITTIDGHTRSVTTRCPASAPTERLFDLIRGIGPHTNGAQLALIEGYQTNAHHAGPAGPVKASELTSIRLGELGGGIRLYLAARKVRVVEVHPSTLKAVMKRVLGHKWATKDDSMSAALTLGYQPANHDEADSAVLHAIGQRWYGDRDDLELTDGLLDLPWPTKEQLHG